MGVLQDDVEGDVGAIPSCSKCGSELVVRDAWASWNPNTGLWELDEVFQTRFCKACEQISDFVWTRAEGLMRAAIRDLNDRFRIEGKGCGSFVITSGVQGFGDAFVQNALQAVRDFDAFTADNDPWGERDFGAFEIQGEKVFWKIDYFDLTLTHGSENPANEGKTARVLTVMLASEY